MAAFSSGMPVHKGPSGRGETGSVVFENVLEGNILQVPQAAAAYDVGRHIDYHADGIEMLRASGYTNGRP